MSSLKHGREPHDDAAGEGGEAGTPASKIARSASSDAGAAAAAREAAAAADAAAEEAAYEAMKQDFEEHKDQMRGIMVRAERCRRGCVR